MSCLGNHSSKACKSTCLKCHKRHHSSLHFEHSVNAQESLHTSTQTHFEQSPFVSLTTQDTTSTETGPKTVIFGTTLVKVTSPYGTSHILRAFIDNGSMCGFISERAAQLLNCTRVKSNLQVLGLSQSPAYTRGTMNLTIETLTGNLIAYHHQVHILDKISVYLPRVQISNEVISKVKPFILADPDFHFPGPIDLLIGCTIFPLLLFHENYSLGPNMPHVMGTHFGFVVMGSAPCLTPSKPINNLFIALLSTSDNELQNSLQRFWQM